MTEPLIRHYATRDSDALVRIITDYRNETARSEPDRQAIAAALTPFAASTEHRLLVAERTGQVIGYTAFHFVPFPMVQGIEAYVSDLLVSAAARGSGVGALLLRSVEVEARARGCVRLMLNNHKTDASYLRGFYRKHEFRQRDEFANLVKVLR